MCRKLNKFFISRALKTYLNHKLRRMSDMNFSPAIILLTWNLIIKDYVTCCMCIFSIWLLIQHRTNSSHSQHHVKQLQDHFHNQNSFYDADVQMKIFQTILFVKVLSCFQLKSKAKVYRQTVHTFFDLISL